jgi:P27 family predicted phage terminase small subunit
MARGRPKTPIEKMKARSPDGKTPGHRTLVPVSPTTPDRTVPELPDGIEGRGAVEWDRVWTAGFWLKRDQDWPWVEMISRAYQDIDVFRRQVEEDGLVVTGYAGQPAAHPLIGEINKLQQTIMKCLQVLGFSPTDRARLMLGEAKAQNALQQMIEAQRAGKG